MPKVAYSEAERENIRSLLVLTGLELMARQGFRHTTVEQIYSSVGISRTFFYSFFSSKEELLVEALYLQQPKVISYARNLMNDPSLTWREAVRRFLLSCCKGRDNGIAILSMEDQQVLFERMSAESLHLFREKQLRLFSEIMKCFGIAANEEQVKVMINLSLAVILISQAMPDSLPFLLSEASDETTALQIETVIDYLEGLKSRN